MNSNYSIVSWVPVPMTSLLAADSFAYRHHQVAWQEIDCSAVRLTCNAKATEFIERNTSTCCAAVRGRRALYPTLRGVSGTIDALADCNSNAWKAYSKSQSSCCTKVPVCPQRRHELCESCPMHLPRFTWVIFWMFCDML